MHARNAEPLRRWAGSRPIDPRHPSTLVQVAEAIAGAIEADTRASWSELAASADLARPTIARHVATMLDAQVLVMVERGRAGRDGLGTRWGLGPTLTEAENML